MGVCPVCEEDITSNQGTAHRLVDGTPARIHSTHLAPAPVDGVPSTCATGARQPNQEQ